MCRTVSTQLTYLAQATLGIRQSNKEGNREKENQRAHEDDTDASKDEL